MLADIICLLWVIMSTVFGMKRRVRMEFASLSVLLVSYFGARVMGIILTEPLASALYGPFGARLIVTLLAWILLYFFSWYIIRGFGFYKPRENIRVDIDASGEPTSISFATEKLLGGVIGFLRGFLLFAALIAILVPLIPLMWYSNGKGTAMVHPDSLVISWIRTVDPDLIGMDDSAKGLRSIRYFYRSPKLQAEYLKDPEIKRILRIPSIKYLRKRKRLLRKASSEEQGVRDATLLLWMKLFQETIVDKKRVRVLSIFAKRIPAPIDRKP